MIQQVIIGILSITAFFLGVYAVVSSQRSIRNMEEEIRHRDLMRDQSAPDSIALTNLIKPMEDRIKKLELSIESLEYDLKEEKRHSKYKDRLIAEAIAHIATLRLMLIQLTVDPGPVPPNLEKWSVDRMLPPEKE